MRLSDIFLELQAQNANNINLVTPSHYVLQIREALLLAKEAQQQRQLRARFRIMMMFGQRSGQMLIHLSM